jgi:hypothetical protein
MRKPEFDHAELKILWEAVTQFVENSDPEVAEDPTPDQRRAVDAAQALVEKLDAYFAAPELPECSRPEELFGTLEEKRAPDLPERIRVDISPDPDFTKRGWGMRVRKIGGEYSECRGYADKRFVTLPFNADGRALASSLTKTFPTPPTFRGKGNRNKVTWVAEGLPVGTPAWVAVHEVDKDADWPDEEFVRLYQAALRQARGRGIVP